MNADFKQACAPLALALAVLLAACGDSSKPGALPGGGSGTVIGAGEQLKPDGQGRPCRSGLGRTYDVTIPSPLGNGETIAATVFEPALMDCSKKYPLVLAAAGWSSPRQTSLVPTDPQTIAFLPFAPLDVLVAAGYGVLSVDNRAFGQSGGRARLQDPDYEGANVVRAVDWAEANLDWLAYGPSEDGSDPHNLMLGSIGPSYGGAFQHMLLAIDPKQRLDAIVPSVTWHDLSYSLAQGGVLKEQWLHGLHDQVKDTPEKLDPFLLQLMDQAFADNRPDQQALDFLRYHGLGYFCGGRRVATNGGSGTAPRLAPRYPPKVNALYIQSSRDTIFNLNEALANYECLKPNGGDVRIFTDQIGHNSTGLLVQLGVLAFAFPRDPGIIYQPDPTSTGVLCGGTTTIQAVLAFFNEHLKGMGGQADQVLGTQPICLSLTAVDSVKVDAIQRGGRGFDIAADAPGNTVTVGQDNSQTTTVPLLTVSDVSNVLAGIPTLDVTLTDPDNPSARGGDTIIYVGIGQKHLLGLTPWDLVDNQLTPLRGLGHHRVEMSGVLERAQVGDQLGLMIFGANDNQYPTAGLTVVPPHAVRVRVQGTVQLPLLGNLLPALTP
ncbi:hypothetical protein D0B54_07375 [Solimonas sp. K1W22B-7]|uniref:alpha/beta hydrolase n=1 Tax=Solimonas sp. K1W22B-7 TaxID=2303331 RepID=UPI000E32F53F|nr:CocE/NonD family hydrolase [Solimonas sp. K1W22B-7]AXQ28515.1 hypothetical protein D0B54_07375 [Solimonas sp. K1W22B-7]